MVMGIFAEELKETLNPHEPEDVKLVQKGMMLYRQGMVQHMRIDEGRSVQAVVQDVIPVKVELDLEFPGLSECTCPSGVICRHMMAVFFAAYGKTGSAAEWMEEWREPVREANQLAKWGIQRAKDLVKANGILEPDYKRWVQSMEESFDSIIKSKKYINPYLVGEMFQIYERRLMAGAPNAPEWRPLYELIANVVSFKKLVRLSKEMEHDEEMVKRSYLHVIHQVMDDAAVGTARISQRPLPFDFDTFISAFTEETTDLLHCTQEFEYERIYLYRMLWADFFKKKEWREAELERIVAGMKQLQDWESPFPFVIAAIHLHLLLENDERVLHFIEAVEKQSIVPYLLYWIDYLNEQKAWKRAGALIELFIGMVRSYLDVRGSYQACSSFTRLALKSLSPYCTETGRADVYERALMQMIPYSFYDYEHLLFTRGQYDKWGELYSFTGIPFTDVPKERIKVIEKEQPEVLFALLHQTVQHEIELKNRSSYKLAVRHLKKLRTLYKKLKRTDDWDFFFMTLLEKTKRLRAFQEECKRSKLIDA